MGVINASADSFWPGSRHSDPAAAVAAAQAMVAAGAHLLDLGAVSSRPRAPAVSLDEELARLLPVLQAVRAAVDCPITVDTARARVAAAALEAGAQGINDVSGISDPGMIGVVRDAGAPLIATLRDPLPPGTPVLDGVLGGLLGLRRRMEEAGLPTEAIMLDPGFGFAKSPAQSLSVVAAIPALRAGSGCPLCIGPSRKAAVAQPLGGRSPGRRRSASAAVVALCSAYGADIVRVHDVAVMAEVAAVAAAVGQPLSREAGADRPRSRPGVGTICVQGIRVEACHGVLAEEHTRPQPFVVDLELDADLRAAAGSDRLGDTINYAAAAAVAAQVLAGPHRDLLERLAGEIAADLLRAFPALEGGAVVLHKPRAPIGLPFEDVSVRLPFSRRGR